MRFNLRQCTTTLLMKFQTFFTYFFLFFDFLFHSKFTIHLYPSSLFIWVGSFSDFAETWDSPTALKKSNRDWGRLLTQMVFCWGRSLFLILEISMKFFSWNLILSFTCRFFSWLFGGRIFLQMYSFLYPFSVNIFLLNFFFSLSKCNLPEQGWVCINYVCYCNEPKDLTNSIFFLFFSLLIFFLRDTYSHLVCIYFLDFDQWCHLP